MDVLQSAAARDLDSSRIGNLYAATSGEQDSETALAPLGWKLGGTSGILFVDDPACAKVELLALPG